MAAQKRADRDANRGKPSKPTEGSKSENVRGKKVDGPEGHEVTNAFKGYNVEELGIPREAWPFKDREYKGKHSYTVNFGPAAAKFKLNERVIDP